MQGLRGIIRWMEQKEQERIEPKWGYKLAHLERNWNELQQKLKELEKEIVLHQRHYDENGFAYRELQEILGPEVK